MAEKSGVIIFLFVCKLFYHPRESILRKIGINSFLQLHSYNKENRAIAIYVTNT